MRALVKEDRQLLHARDFRGGATPLAVAVAACKPECVRVLLEAGADVNEIGDEAGATPLILAVGSLDDEGTLLFKVADARRRIEQLAEGAQRREAQAKLEEAEKKQMTPELRAKIPLLPLPASPERIEIINMLLKRKPDLKAKDKQGRTAMHFAAGF
ncbi:MAG: ankyrin repeat domain-containing protein, partial [Akkermansiaceae bacterium]|nr:ankyrin repeat domain-containing protein [Akkermansiaceae bacterium]